MFIQIALIGAAVVGWATYKKRPKTKATVKKLTSSIKKISPKKQLEDIKSVKSLEEGQNLPEEMDQFANNIVLSGGSVIAAILGSIYPGFTFLAILGVLYLLRGPARLALKDIKDKRYLSTFVVGVVADVGMLITGHVLIAASAALVGDIFVRIIERTENNAQKQLINVFGELPSMVWVRKEGVEIQVDFTTIKSGDTVVISAGGMIPVDGTVQEGMATVDQHILTGESQPLEKVEGDKVFASTLIVTGRIYVLVEKAGQDTVAAKIGTILNDTQEYKNTLITRGQKLADTFLPLQLGISAITLPLLGATSAITILWASLGATMVVLGPISVLNYLRLFSQRGILIKDGRVLESLNKVDTVVFDKTGTLTLEQPKVGKIHCLSEWDENTVLLYAAAAEYRQPHPIAKAILEKAADLKIELPDLDNAQYELGYGIKVLVDGKLIRVGSARFMEREGIQLPQTVKDIQALAEEEGFSLIYVGIDQALGGILEMHPCIRPEAVKVVRYLKQRGMQLYIISGDHEHPTRKLAEQLGIDHYLAEVLPEHKAKQVEMLANQGRFVCFIGDGINDSIALKSAHVSISLQGASTAATDTAQVIFMDGTLGHIEQLFNLTDKFEKTMTNNLLSSLIPGTICIGGVYFLHISLATGVVLFYTGATTGLLNSFLPLLRYEDKKIEINDQLLKNIK
jgi:Cu2+-exporting ATPase